jgi:hypothetical protein
MVNIGDMATGEVGEGQIGLKRKDLRYQGFYIRKVAEQSKHVSTGPGKGQIGDKRTSESYIAFRQNGCKGCAQAL